MKSSSLSKETTRPDAETKPWATDLSLKIQTSSPLRYRGSSFYRLNVCFVRFSSPQSWHGRYVRLSFLEEVWQERNDNDLWRGKERDSLNEKAGELLWEVYPRTVNSIPYVAHWITGCCCCCCCLKRHVLTDNVTFLTCLKDLFKVMQSYFVSSFSVISFLGNSQPRLQYIGLKTVNPVVLYQFWSSRPCSQYFSLSG